MPKVPSGNISSDAQGRHAILHTLLEKARVSIIERSLPKRLVKYEHIPHLQKKEKHDFIKICEKISQDDLGVQFVGEIKNLDPPMRYREFLQMEEKYLNFRDEISQRRAFLSSLQSHHAASKILIPDTEETRTKSEENFVSRCFIPPPRSNTPTQQDPPPEPQQPPPPVLNQQENLIRPSIIARRPITTTPATTTTPHPVSHPRDPRLALREKILRKEEEKKFSPTSPDPSTSSTISPTPRSIYANFYSQVETERAVGNIPQ